MKTHLVALVTIAYASTIGCAEIGNFFIPPHSSSDYGGDSKTCLYLLPKPSNNEALPAVAGIAASAAIGVLVDRTAAAIKQESTRYQASYSARATRALVSINASGTPSYSWDTLKFVRYLGKSTMTCDELDSLGDQQIKTNNLERAIQLEAKLIREPAPEIVIQTLDLNKAKAKVASSRWFVPWSWWMLLDRSAEMVDLKATVTLSALVKTENGSQSKDIVSADLPLGKHKLPVKIDNVKDVSTGPFVLPNPGCGKSCSDLLTTATVTITESNELGDIIGDASKKVADNKQSIVNFVLKELKVQTSGGQ